MRDRRLGFRIPLDLIMTSYVRERPLRALVSDLSDTGLRADVVSGMAPPPGTPIALELQLPGSDEPIWALGEVCYQRPDELASGLGVRFVAMASVHAREVREFCVEARRGQLGALLARIAAPVRARLPAPRAIAPAALRLGAL
ncbi:MAG: PilZ domain-containing protein [Kofleriaceae bacterium]|nr:PilZ domain-containing protein [Kofleriaceae bacterium]